MQAKMRSTLYICVFALLLFGCKETEIEKVKLTELNGAEINLADFEGKAVFINFWATWCGPCIKEMPTIEKAQAALKDKDVVFLMASNEDVDEIREFTERRPLDLRFVRLLNMEELNIPALPTTFIYDREGTLKFSETGTRDWSKPENIKLIEE